METDCNHICHCPCHTQRMMHFVECCYTCSYCDKNIKAKVGEHEAQCHGHTELDK